MRGYLPKGSKNLNVISGIIKDPTFKLLLCPSSKESHLQYRRLEGDESLIPESGRCPGEGNSNPLQYSCLRNPKGREAWWSIVHRLARDGHDRAHMHTLILLHTHTHTHTHACTHAPLMLKARLECMSSGNLSITAPPPHHLKQCPYDKLECVFSNVFSCILPKWKFDVLFPFLCRALKTF